MTFEQAIELARAIGTFGILIAALFLIFIMVTARRANQDMHGAFKSMRDAFQIHAGHCHVQRDADQLALDLRTTIARIEQAHGLEEGDGMRAHLLDRLAECDARRLKSWVEVIQGRQAHAEMVEEIPWPSS